MNYWIVIFASLGAAIGIYLLCINWRDEPFLGILNVILCALCGSLIGTAVMVIHAEIDPLEPREDVWTRELKALNTGSKIQGTFYLLGSGQIESSRHLRYIRKKDKENEYVIRDAPADRSTIRTYSDTTKNKPRIEVHNFSRVSNNWRFSLRKEDYYIFHVPENSVLNNIKVTP